MVALTTIVTGVVPVVVQEALHIQVYRLPSLCHCWTSFTGHVHTNLGGKGKKNEYTADEID